MLVDVRHSLLGGEKRHAAMQTGFGETSTLGEGFGDICNRGKVIGLHVTRGSLCCVVLGSITDQTLGETLGEGPLDPTTCEEERRGEERKRGSAAIKGRENGEGEGRKGFSWYGPDFTVPTVSSSVGKLFSNAAYI
jgi:hypothetical protein